jgi:4-amino-4-deoxy-L-arabinose transferase-like glycosyltransferase
MSPTPTQLRSPFSQPMIRKYWLVISLILVVVGQSLVRDPLPYPFFQKTTDILVRWNEDNYLSLDNPVNVLIGLLTILFGTIIHAFLFASQGKSQDINFPENNWAHWKRSIPWVIANFGIYTLIMIQLARHQNSVTLFWGWLTTLLIFTILFWTNEHKLETLIHQTDILWMLILFALAIIIGSYMLNDLPAGWIADEGPFWVAARSIAIGESAPSFFDTGVYTFPIASSILQGWIMRWAGVNMWGWRFASVLSAACVVFPLYLLTRELFDRRTAIVANVMMIANPYFLAFARLGYNNIQALFPVTFCIYFLILGLRRNNRFYLWLAGLAGLGFYTYFAAWLGLVVAILTPVAFALVTRQKFQKSLSPLLIVTTAAFLVFLPRILYGVSGDSDKSLSYKIWETGPINLFYGKFVFGDERIAEADIFTIDGVEVFYDPDLYGIVLLRGFIRTTAALFDPIGYNDHQIVFGLAGPGSSLFFALGLGVALANFKKFRYLTPLVFFLSGFVFLGVLASLPPRPTHMVAIIPALAMISAIGLISFLDALTKTDTSIPDGINRNNKIATAGILTIIVLMGCFQYFFMLPYAYAPPSQDDYISWLGRQISTPVDLYLINHYATLRNPMDESERDMTPHTVTTFTPADIDAAPEQVKQWNHFVAFVSLQSGAAYADNLAAQIPGASVQAAFVTGQRRRGYVISDLPVNTSMDISLQHGITDLWNSPARSILLFCGLGIILLLVIQWMTSKTSNKMSEIP